MLSELVIICVITLTIGECPSLVSADSVQREQDKHGQSTAVSTPKDYTHSTTNSRVKDLVGYFELLDKTSNDAKLSQKTSVILSLAESATKLYTLNHGLAPDVKCNRYVRLISMPDIRSVATISALMKESPSLTDQVQPDANLVAYLDNERKFEALARIQTIIQTLESEQVMGKSNFEPNVKRDLLECINYYVYRHQKATSSVIDYVRSSMASLSNSLIEPTESKIFVDKFSQPIETIMSIEAKAEVDNSKFNYQEWLAALMKLKTLAMQNNFEIPQMVTEFLANTDRFKRLQLWLESDELRNEILLTEPNLSWFSMKTDASQEYRNALKRLHELCDQQQMKPPQEVCQLLEDPKRSAVVQALVKQPVSAERVELGSTQAKPSLAQTSTKEEMLTKSIFSTTNSSPSESSQASIADKILGGDLKNKLNEGSEIFKSSLSTASDWINNQVAANRLYDNWWKPSKLSIPDLQVKAGKLYSQLDNNLLAKLKA